jgi:hypothetical protein
MMTAFAFVGQPAAPSVVPAQINPAGPPGRQGDTGLTGAPGINGRDGDDGAPGVIQSINGASAPSLSLRDIGAAATGHTPVSDANYQVLASDVDVAYTALTAPRTVKLCDVDTYPLGQDLVIGDESGSCSSNLPITILVGDGTSDTIPQQSDNTIVLAYAYASVRLRRGAADIWKIV